jgi:hypothetical protein
MVRLEEHGARRVIASGHIGMLVGRSLDTEIAAGLSTRSCDLLNGVRGWRAQRPAEAPLRGSDPDEGQGDGQFNRRPTGSFSAKAGNVSEIGGKQIVRTSASANIKSGCCGTYQITVRIERVQQA